MNSDNDPLRPELPADHSAAKKAADSESPSVQYMQQVIAWQPRLYAFILSLTGNPNEADDVLQNTNLALLQKQNAYRPDAKFIAWAMQMAYLEVQRHRDSNARARRRIDDTLLDQLAARGQESVGEPAVELRTLRDCMLRLSPPEREMLTLRYGGKSVQAIAERWGRTVGSISQTLYRVRGKLAECVKRGLRVEHRDEL
jgi:RNA polymerase sigma-70 factor, ECF subfamily